MDERISIFLRKRWIIPVAVGAITFSGGLCFGYILGMRRSQKTVKYIHSKDDFQMTKKDKVPSNPTYEVNLPPKRPDPTDDHENYQPLRVNVFLSNNTDDVWDYEIEMTTRTHDVPYVIHRDEFFNEEMDYHQSTLTYFRGDDILIDENDVPIYNYVETVGELKFGHGSGDKNVVYIRNERIECEYEVLLSNGYYTVEILGEQIEEDLSSDDLKHSTPKFRKLE